MVRPALFIIGASLFASSAVAESGYLNSCDNCSFITSKGQGWDVGMVICHCKDKRGNRLYNSLQTGKCFANDLGHVIYRPNGGWQGSCVYSTENEGRVQGVCANGSGGWESFNINLNDYIGNDNGVMKCHGLSWSS